MLRTAIAIAALAGLAVVAGCSGDHEANPTPTTSAAASPTSARTDVPAIIDLVVTAVTSGDPARLKALIQYQTLPCISVPSGQGGPPLCADGEAEGTPVEAMIESSCEGNYVRKDAIDTQGAIKRAVGTSNKLWAAYEYTGDAFGPGAHYFIIFERPEPVSNGTGYGIVTSGDGVLGVHYGCGWSPEEFARFTRFGPAVIPPTS